MSERSLSHGFDFQLSEEEWRSRLTPDQYRVLRQHGTEKAGGSCLNDEKRYGIFYCAGCQSPLFVSHTKFESHSGWPSFWEPLPAAIGMTDDTSHGMHRTEVHCATCGGHLGHVFPDGPPPTGLRYCINGIALHFEPE